MAANETLKALDEAFKLVDSIPTISLVECKDQGWRLRWEPKAHTRIRTIYSDPDDLGFTKPIGHYEETIGDFVLEQV